MKGVVKVVRVVSLRQARHPLELQDQPQGYHRIIDVTAASGVVQPIGNMAPGALLAAAGRQILE